MTYDNWKTTNPADEFLGPEPCEVCGGDKVLPVLSFAMGGEAARPCPICCTEEEIEMIERM
jgi:hypothetical protein